MSILTELEAALEAKQGCDERCIACVPSPCERVYDLLDLDTIAALVAVAEAVDAENNSSGEAARQAYVRGRAALASLVKEADHDRA